MIKGMSMLVKLGTKVIGGQKGASLEMSAELADVSCKGDAWKKSLAMQKAWTVEADGLYVASDVAYKELQDAFVSGVEVDLSLTNGTVNYSGKALVSSLSVEVPYDDAMTYKVSFEGTGALSTVAGE